MYGRVLLKDPGVLLKDPGVLLKDPGVLLKDPGVLLKDPGVLLKGSGVLLKEGPNNRSQDRPLNICLLSVEQPFYIFVSGLPLGGNF